MDKTNATISYASSFKNFSLDHDRIREFLKLRRTFVADRTSLAKLVVDVAEVIGVDANFVLTLLKLEVGYPVDYEVYRSTMRGGANNAYVGVSQMYDHFWTDVRKHFAYAGTLPAKKEDTTLEMQLIAPFLYAERYKDGLIRQQYPFSPAVIYTAHQQGGPSVGRDSFGTSSIAGRQSGVSVRVVNEVKRFSKTKRPMEPVWI